MTMHPQFSLTGILLVWLLTMPSLVEAEWFIGLYGGRGSLNSSDVDVTADTTEQLGFDIDATLFDVEADDFITGGLRTGYWFAGFPAPRLSVGIGLDMMLFNLDIPEQTVTATSNTSIVVDFDDEPFEIEAGVSAPVDIPELQVFSAIFGLDFMLRLSLLTSPAHPQGRLQPYLTAAPAILITDESADVALGFKGGAGLSWVLHRHVALFAEYRYAAFDPTISRGSVRVNGIRISSPDVDVKIRAHYILAGLSIRF